MVVQGSRRVLDHVADLVDPAKQQSVNGVDITVHKVFTFTSKLVIDFDNARRKNPGLEELPFTGIDGDESDPMNHYWDLASGAYMVGYGQKVSIPMDCVGVILPRSTLMAGGVFLASALWDSGYTGYGRGLLTVSNPHGARVYNKARIGQIIFLSAGQVDKGYAGTYQDEGKR